MSFPQNFFLPIFLAILDFFALKAEKKKKKKNPKKQTHLSVKPCILSQMENILNNMLLKNNFFILAK